MKIMSRDFTLKEKVLLGILFVLLLCAAYYWLVYVPCSNAIAAANADRDKTAVDLTIARAKEDQLIAMQKELDSLGELQYASRMPSYNSSNEELSLLNGILMAADDYAVSFASASRNGDQIRRNFTMQFKTRNFATAKDIIRRLSESELRCLIGDIQYVTTLRRAAEGEAYTGGRMIDNLYYFDVITVDMTATFFETMVGGTPDAGLPADKAA